MKCAQFAPAAALWLVSLMATWTAPPVVAEENSSDTRKTATADLAATGRTAIVAALDQPVTIEFKEASLNDVISYLKKDRKVEIQLDSQALSDAGIDPATSIVSYSLSGQSFKSAMGLILDELGLAAVIRDEVLLVTAKAEAESILTTRVYGVLDLITSKDNPELDFEPLIELISGCVNVETWSELGGPATIDGLHSNLVVAQTDDGHDKIAELLDTLRAVQKSQAAEKFEPARMIGTSNRLPTKLDKLLHLQTSMKYEETPLTEVLKDLTERTGLPFQLDSTGIAAAGIDPSSLPITIELHSMPVGAAMKNLLRPHGLSLVCKHEVPLITTKEQAKLVNVIAVYPVADLIGPHSQTEAEAKLNHEAADQDALIDLITATIATHTWSELGGPGTIDSFDAEYPALVILQTAEVHEQIESLLTDLRKSRKAQAGNLEKMATQPAKPAGPELRVYTLVLADPKFPLMTPKEVVEMVKALVEPKGWSNEGVFIQGVTGRLVVKQTPAVHREILELLKKLRMTSEGFGFSGPTATGGGGGF